MANLKNPPPHYRNCRFSFVPSFLEGVFPLRLHISMYLRLGALVSMRSSHGGPFHESFPVEIGGIKEYAEPDKLLLDIDKLDAPDVAELWSMVLYIGLKPVNIRLDQSSSGRWHVIIRIEQKLAPPATVAAQLALGSDPDRERCNLNRAFLLGDMPEKQAKVGFRTWNVLYGRKLK
jgi:hypothetical protein